MESSKPYLTGFFLSALLTLAAYGLVVGKLFSGGALDFAVASLAMIQAMIQLVLFLNLGKEAKPRWNLITFLFMVLVVLLIVFGSLWIMKNLNYNLMPT